MMAVQYPRKTADRRKKVLVQPAEERWDAGDQNDKLRKSGSSPLPTNPRAKQWKASLRDVKSFLMELMTSLRNSSFCKPQREWKRCENWGTVCWRSRYWTLIGVCRTALHGWCDSLAHQPVSHIEPIWIYSGTPRYVGWWADYVYTCILYQPTELSWYRCRALQILVQQLRAHLGDQPHWARLRKPCSPLASLHTCTMTLILTELSNYRHCSSQQTRYPITETDIEIRP